MDARSAGTTPGAVSGSAGNSLSHVRGAGLAAAAAPPLVFAVALALYLRTLAPGLTWAHAGADGGDLLAAALTGGVPHPTGYPSYVLLLRAVAALDAANPARAGNLLSAVAAAATAALLADFARRVLGRIFPPAQTGHALVAATTALAWAAAPAVWAQATITEVYTLNALACVLVLWLLWRFAEARNAGKNGAGWLAGAGLTTGLGLGNHATLILVLPGAATWLWYTIHPGWRSSRTALAAGGAGLLAGLSVYATLPLMASGQPPVNWGNPVTPGGFLWVVTGRLYESLLLGAPVGEWPTRGWEFLREGAEQFGGPWGMLGALAGLYLLARRLPALWLASLLITLGFSIQAITYGSADSLVNLLPAWAMASLWLAVALGWTIGKVAGKMAGNTRGAVVVCLVALALLPGVSLMRHWEYNDLSGENEAVTLGEAVLTEAEPDALILTATDGPTFLLWYLRYGLKERPDLTPVNVNLLGFDWYRASLAAHHVRSLGGADLADGLETWLPGVAARRPVYRVEPLGLPTGLVEQPGAALVRLYPPPAE